jgi:hypothetical protein
MEAKERFQLQLRRAEVALHPTETSVEEVAHAIEALFAWGNVTRFLRPARPRDHIPPLNQAPQQNRDGSRHPWFAETAGGPGLERAESDFS